MAEPIASRKVPPSDALAPEAEAEPVDGHLVVLLRRLDGFADEIKQLPSGAPMPRDRVEFFHDHIRRAAESLERNRGE